MLVSKIHTQDPHDSFDQSSRHITTLPNTFSEIPEHLITGIVEVGGTTLQWTVQLPEEIRYPGIARIVNGFGGYKATSRVLRKALAQEGFVTCTEEPVRANDATSWDDLTDPQAAHVQTHRAVHDAIFDHPEFKESPHAKDIAKEATLWLPHSMGGLSVARLVDEKPDETVGIINLMAAGYGSPNILQLARTLPKGIPGGIKKELIPYLRSGHINPDLDNFVRITQYYARNPFRTAGEAWSCIREDVRPRAERIRNAGIRIGYLAAEFDCLVPPDDSIADHVDTYREIKGMGHLGPQLKPNDITRNVSDIVFNYWNLT
jgi:hypothetical protein